MRSTDYGLRAAAASGLLLIVLGLTSCVSNPVPRYEPGIDNTEAILKSRLRPLAVDAFDASPGVDRPLSMRGTSVAAPGGSFAAYLRDAMVTELDAAGRYDAKSSVRLTATLLRNELHAASAKTGRASIAARVRVLRDGHVVFDRTIEGENRWDSSFLGAIALPAALDHYGGALHHLVANLVADPEFRKAAEPES